MFADEMTLKEQMPVLVPRKNLRATSLGMVMLIDITLNPSDDLRTRLCVFTGSYAKLTDEYLPLNGYVSPVILMCIICTWHRHVYVATFIHSTGQLVLSVSARRCLPDAPEALEGTLITTVTNVRIHAKKFNPLRGQ